MPFDHPCSSRARAGVPGFALLVLVLAAAPAFAQVFTRVSDATNPIVTDAGAPGFAGSSWIDADGNGWPDLFVGERGLYLNAGGGSFSRVTVANTVAGLGHSWGDYDNDGDPDLMIAGGANGGHGSRLYRNDGGGASFTQIQGGVIGDSLGLTGWSCAWGDYDADGFLDLVIAQAQGFTGSGPNRLLHNQGDGTFVRDLATDVTVGTAPYTVPSWCDFDLDGDLDLSIGAGPANGSKGVDYFYRNLRIEGGSPPLLDRILTGALATEVRDGQIVNWPDYDNDGDLDCFITNYRSSVNHLYRNDAGTYVRMTGAEAGAIATDIGWNLANLWHDFDNDGDLDCFVGRTSGFPNRYYRNEGNGLFTSQNVGEPVSTPSATAVAADYDQDGDLDLYVSAPGPAKGLFRNDLPAGNHWFQLRLAGLTSNRSGIGAKVRLRTTIGGQVVTQIRELSAQNSFNGHSSPIQHFGLGDAAVIEWLSVEWPRGLVETFTNLPVDTTLTLVEGQGFPTATLAALVEARVTSEGVELEWYGSALEPDRAVVYRRPADRDDWSALGAPVETVPHTVTYVDRGVRPGTWVYRLGDGRVDVEWLTGESWVEVPAGRLSLRASTPPALGGRLRLAFELPREGSVRAAVFDARGRRVAGGDLGPREAGAHVAELDGRALRPGVYWIRLTHDRDAVTARAVVPGER
jgi:hypothetical protein